TGAARKFIKSNGYVPRKGARLEPKRGMVSKLGVAIQFVPGQLHEQSFVDVEERLRLLITNFELFTDLVIEVFQQLAARLSHRLIDLKAEFKLKLIEGDFYLLVLAAALVDLVN